MSLRIVTIVFLLSLPNLNAQPAQVIARSLEFVKANYTKYEFEVPMRDGKKLFTAVYAPKDTAQRYPILITRTPYSVAPYGVDNYRTALGPSEKFQEEFFIFVYQDVRGRYLSEGEFVEVRPKGAVDESTDDYRSPASKCSTLVCYLLNFLSFPASQNDASALHCPVLAGSGQSGRDFRRVG